MRPKLIWIFFVRNHVKPGVSLRVPYYVEDAGYGLGRGLEVESIKWLKHKLRATIGGQ